MGMSLAIGMAIGGGTIGMPAGPVQAIFTQTIPFMGYAVPSGEIDDDFPGLVAEVAEYVSDGIKIVRIDFRQSTLGGGNYTAQDARVAALVGAGIKIIGILNPSTDLSDSTERAAYAAYCGVIAARYAGDVDVWEIVNEPNIASTKVLMADYVAAMSAVDAAITAADADVEVSYGSLASVPETTGDFQAAVPYAQLIWDNFASIFANPKRSLCYHAYTDSTTTGWLSNLGASWHTRTILQAILAIGFQRVHVTETGMPTIGSGFTEANQFKWLQESYTELSTWPEIASYIWYSPRNRQAEAVGQDGYGLRRANGAPKLVRHRIVALTALENDSTPEYEHHKGEGDTTHSLFRRFADAIGGGLTFSAVSLPTGVSVSSAGVLTVADASVTPQLATPCAVLGTAANGTTANFEFTFTCYHPDLLGSSGNFDALGGVTGYTASSINAGVSFDADQRALLCDITGTGGGVNRSGTVVVQTGVTHELCAVLRKGDYAGTQLNMFIGGVATSPATITPTSDYAEYRTSLAPASSPVNFGVTRFGSFIGDFHVRRFRLRRKL